VRLPFRAFPAATGGALTPRPIVDIALEGLPVAPIACLLDTGALRTRISAEFASLAGIALDSALIEEFHVAGLKTVGALARIGLTVSDGISDHSWDAPVWFCDPWPYPFGLAGLEGFMYHFSVSIHAYDAFLDLQPHS
jgi:hypothetical protein